MTLSQLKTVCAAYLGKGVADLTIDSVDMFLMAANNVRKNAELLHDFEYTRVKATLSIDGANGADLSDAVIEGNEIEPEVDADFRVTGTLSPDVTGLYKYVGDIFGGTPVYANVEGNGFIITQPNMSLPIPWQIKELAYMMEDGAPNMWQNLDGGTAAAEYGGFGSYTGIATVAVHTASSAPLFSGLKSITNVQRSRADGTYIPLDFTRADIAVERERTELEFQDDYFPAVRYPSDAQFLNRGSTSTLIQRGNKLFVYPVGTETTQDLEVVVEGYAFYRDYTAADLASGYSGDLFLQQGSRFLQWAIITELNYLFQRFVPRQEGVLSPPEQAREAAWRDLLLWDSYLIDPNSTRSR